MKIQVNRNINAPTEAIWAYLSDFSNIRRFHPLLKNSYFIDGSEHNDLGATRQCDLKDGNFIKEKITDWKEGSHYAVDIVESSMPIKKAKAVFGVRSTGKNTSEVYMDMDITPKSRLMKPMLYAAYKYKALPAILKSLEDLYLKEHKLELA